VLRNLFNPTYTHSTVLDDVTTHINPNEKVALIGRNGSGKSSLIKAICGITKPSTGAIEVLGYSPSEDRRKIMQSTGVMFAQKSFLYPNLTLTDCVDLYSAARQLSPHEKQKNFALLNSFFEISDFSSKQVRTLSFGQRVRGELLCSLIHNPKLIILDEPTVGIDVNSKQMLHRFLTDTSFMQSKTVIITSHEPQIIRDFADRCIEMSSGKITYDGPTTNYNLGLSVELQISFKDVTRVESKQHSDSITSFLCKESDLTASFKPGTSELFISEWISKTVGLENITKLDRVEKLYSEVA
jgi:ABC-2 type transport system ATP-binding protein